MERNTIENILNFLEEKEGMELPESWFDSIEKLKLIKRLENHPDGPQYRYDGQLDLSYSKITKLPDNLYVDDSLDLGNCKQLTELPDNLYVDGSFSIQETNIKKLPNDLYVRRNLYIKNTPLADNYTDEQIYEMIKLRGGELVGKIIR